MTFNLLPQGFVNRLKSKCASPWADSPSIERSDVQQQPRISAGQERSWRPTAELQL